MAERPDLLEAGFTIGPPEHEFMQHDLVGWLYTSGLLTHWSEFGLLLLDDGDVVARAMSVPFAMGVAPREHLPADGWDGIVRWAAEDVLVGREPNSVAALEITVDTARRGSGISSQALGALRANAQRLGFSTLVCPVRPTAKAEMPYESIDSYLRRTRGDGLPVDPWLRVHVRAGGLVAGVAPRSMCIVDSLDQWRAWTGLRFDADGEVDVPGALVPVIVNARQDIGVYVEPNVWVRHDTNTRP